MKKIYCTLLIVSFLLLILCGYNYSLYNSSKSKNQSVSGNIDKYKDDIVTKQNKKEELNKEYEELKEKNKEKITEYEKWQKWTKEIEEKM